MNREEGGALGAGYRRARLVPLTSAAAFAAALLITSASNVPHPLPGIALGSEPLFYIERGVAVFAALVIAIGLLGRGLRGELPSHVSTTGVSYPESLGRAISGSDLALSALTRRVDRLDEDLKKRDEIVTLLAEHVLELAHVDRKEDDVAGPSGD